LFVEHGYAASTVDQIAAAAGVARPTVFAAIGTKREIIKQLRDMALAGDEEPVPVPQRESFQRVWSERDPRQLLALYAENMRGMHGRAADLEAVIEGAADSDAEMRELFQTAQAQRRHGCGLVAAALLEVGTLRPELDQRMAGDVLFALASPEVYRMLVRRCGWTPERYESWLRDTLVLQLLASERPKHTSRRRQT
jgi:AcrR family transcriptional regulator